MILIPEMCPISRRRKLPHLEGIPVSQRSAPTSFWELFVLFGSCRVGTYNVESVLVPEGISSVFSPGLGNAAVLVVLSPLALISSQNTSLTSLLYKI